MAIVRKTFSLDKDVHDDLVYLADRLKVTRSALLSQLIAVPLKDLRALVQDLPEHITEDDILRYRGHSRSIIQERVEKLLRSQDDLFTRAS